MATSMSLIVRSPRSRLAPYIYTYWRRLFSDRESFALSERKVRLW